MLKPRYFFSFLFSIIMLNVPGQDMVPYLLNEPVIDGYADEIQPGFKVKAFDKMAKSDEKNPDIKAGYYLAYNSRFLYLYIEANADSITIRDRSYQNGDGFHLVIGKPQKDMAPTDEFYVLGFSAENSLCHKMIWYYNIDLKMTRLSSDTKFETGSKNGKISFELLIPWKDVYPYHPWFSENIGFNLCFVKAVKDKEKNYYFLNEDEKIQCEQSKRKYDVLRFEPPGKVTSWFSSMLLKSNIGEKEKLVVRLAGFLRTDSTKNITVSVLSGENSIAAYKTANMKFRAGLSENEISVESPDLISGGYKVKVFCEKELIGEHYLSVFPKTNTSDFRSAVRSLGPAVSAGTANTLMFYINDIDSSLSKIKNYECSFSIRNKIAEMDNYLKEFKAGHDLIAGKRGVYRRAYLSEKDNNLYPYSIYVPDDYTGDKKFPLLVYLHGSGDDDRTLSETSIIPEGFIVLAPSGCGTSNCFAGVEPQNDIEDAISDVIKNFSIDTGKILLSGFSMGGYGVYRTYYEHPDRYKAIAVISGDPDLARNWVDPNELNFLEDKNLKKFKKVPVYIFHGINDLNCPFDKTEQLVKKLKKNGCNVTFEIDKAGHGNMDQKIRNRYYEWLKKQIE